MEALAAIALVVWFFTLLAIYGEEPITTEYEDEAVLRLLNGGD